MDSMEERKGETQDKDEGPGGAHVQQQLPDIPQSCLCVRTQALSLRLEN